MSPNQRLIVAVLLSIIFFVGYTAIFPPVEPEVAKDAPVAQKAEPTKSTKVAVVNEEDLGSSALSQEATLSKNQTNILTVKNKDFILKMDTLGRISSKELLQEKFRGHGTDDKHAQLISKDGAKPLYIRFVDEALKKEAAATPYTASIDAINLGDTPQSVTLTQKLASLTVKKHITFYTDGHYDVNIELSKDKRYFVYVGKRPHVNAKEQMMTLVGSLVYTGDDLQTIVQDGDAKSRQTFNDVQLVASFDQYTTTMMYGLGKDTNVMIDKDAQNNPVAYFDGQQNFKFNGYIGQKNFKTLQSINPVLTNVIEYGWFTFAAKPLFAL